MNTESRKSRKLDWRKLECLVKLGLLRSLYDPKNINDSAVFGVEVGATRPPSDGEQSVVIGVRNMMCNAYVADFAESVFKLAIEVEGRKYGKGASGHELHPLYATLQGASIGKTIGELWDLYCQNGKIQIRFPIRMDKASDFSFEEILKKNKILGSHIGSGDEISEGKIPFIPLSSFLKFLDSQNLHSYHYVHEKVGRQWQIEFSLGLADFWEHVLKEVLAQADTELQDGAH